MNLNDNKNVNKNNKLKMRRFLNIAPPCKADSFKLYCFNTGRCHPFIYAFFFKVRSLDSFYQFTFYCYFRVMYNRTCYV